MKNIKTKSVNIKKAQNPKVSKFLTPKCPIFLHFKVFIGKNQGDTLAWHPPGIVIETYLL